MQNKNEKKYFASSCILASVSCALLLTAVLLVYYLIPNNTMTAKDENIKQVAEISTLATDETDEDNVPYFQDYFTEVSLTKLSSYADEGLTLYRQLASRSAVEWFYYQVTGNKSVTQAILSEAEKNDIPLSLAFALAYTESSYNAKAVNKNSNATIDRGLFQLNSNSFPELTEADFFDPFVSSKYGMSHLRFCLNTAGNEVSALAMYNAGTGRVRANKTPQSTLNYVGKIMSYSKMLDQLFTEQVVTYFETQLVPGMTLAYADKHQ